MCWFVPFRAELLSNTRALRSNDTMGFGKDNKGVIIRQSISQAILTLAPDTGLIITAAPVILERFRMLKSEVYANVEGLQTNEGRGLSLWLADGDLTLAQIEECIELSGAPLGPNDPVEAAIAERFVMFVGAAGGSTISHFHDRETNAPYCIIKPRWTFARTKSWNFVLYNIGSVMTTGATVNLRVKNFGVWVT